jgi:exonuclease SbcD
MRFLHIADLHLGKQMNDLLLLDDQEAVLDQIIHIANDEKVDAVLIAGDVYQRTTPQAEAMALFDRFVSRLVDDGRKIFVISGNHDSALRISYFSSLVKNAGVYVTETFNGELQHVTLHDTDGDLNVWMMPFLRPAHVKRALPDEKITSYQDAVAAVIRHADIDFSKRNLLICHA